MSRQRIIECAVAELGTKEYPPGSNETKYNVWFGLTGAKLTPAQKTWCCIFFCFIYDKAGHNIGRGDYLKGFASVPYFLKHFRDRITLEPQMGGAVIYDWQKGTIKETEWSPDHIGIFICWLDRANGVFLAIEGNTGNIDQSNGGEVQLKVRNANREVEAFVNLLGDIK